MLHKFRVLCGNFRSLIVRRSVSLPRLPRMFSTSAKPHPVPEPDGSAKTFPDKIHTIVDQISQLTLLETAQLNELLKVKNLSDTCISAFLLLCVTLPAEECQLCQAQLRNISAMGVCHNVFGIFIVYLCCCVEAGTGTCICDLSQNIFPVFDRFLKCSVCATFAAYLECIACSTPEIQLLVHGLYILKRDIAKTAIFS